MIDFENLAISLRDTVGTAPIDIQPILDLAKERSRSGRVALARAYADWRHFTRYADPLTALGVTTVQAPSYRLQGKNATDIQMAVEATDLMHRRPELELFVLVTGDSDFNPLVNLLHERGKRVIGIGVEGTVSPYLEQVCDEFILYGSLVELPGKEEKPSPRPSPAPKPRTTREKPARSTAASRASTPPAPSPAPPEDEHLALEALGLEANHRLSTQRLKDLLPMAAECLRQAHPARVGDFKRAITHRFPGKITPQEGAILAHLLRQVNVYNETMRRSWLETIGRNGEDGFDMLLATCSQRLSDMNWAHATRANRVAELLTGEPMEPSEASVRLARGKAALKDIAAA